MQDPTQQQQHHTAQLVLSCFSFCPVSQEQSCSTPLGQKPKGQTSAIAAAASAYPAGSRFSGSGSSDSTVGIIGDSVSSQLGGGGVDGDSTDTQQQAAIAAAPGSTPATSSSTDPGIEAASAVEAAAAAAKRPPAPAKRPPTARQAPACTSLSIEWPAGSGYCWTTKHTAGALQHPRPNIYNASNVAVTASNGQLVLRVAKSGRGRSSSSSCAEVSLDRSLGLGTYVLGIDTNPSLVSAAVVCVSVIVTTFSVLWQ
jgi:hypothetical protein